jgi:hypothetical protein
MIANHAAEYEMLDAIKFPGKLKNGKVSLKRIIANDVVEVNNLTPGPNKKIRRTAFDSTSLIQWTKVSSPLL